MIYFFKRKYRQIKNLLKWIPRIWTQFDFDYNYAVDLFKFKLLDIADYLESENAHCVGSKDRSSRIRMIIRLMDKVYNDDYGMEYLDKLEEIYGKELMKTTFIDTNDGTGSSLLKYNYELTLSDEKIKEIDEVKDRLFEESKEKQERAHQLLWKLIEHNIRGWWD